MKNSKIFLFAFAFQLALYAKSQDNIHGLREHFGKVFNAYNEAEKLSFDVSYSFWNQDKPNQILDSLKGSIKLNGDKQWYVLGGTETIKNKGRTVLLFTEDKLMYLVNTPEKEMTNPLSFIDSTILKYIVGGEVKIGNNDLVLNFQFSEHVPYKSIQYQIDLKTYFIKKVLCRVDARVMYDESVRNLVEGQEIAVIEAVFKNYNQSIFNDGDFDLTKYFFKEGSEYKPTEAFKSYSIFLGSPNF